VFSRRIAVCVLPTLFASIVASEASETVTLRGLHHRVRQSDTIVLARVVDPGRALVRVERVLKGKPPKQITLVPRQDSYEAPAARHVLTRDARELLFLAKKGDMYVPLVHWTVDGARLIDPSSAEPRNYLKTIATIERLTTLEARAARGSAEANAACVAALKSDDDEVRLWAFWEALDETSRLRVPSAALADALVARWPKNHDGLAPEAGLVTNAVVRLRIQRVAPFFAKILATSGNDDERAWAAMALGGTGDRTYLPVLRTLALEDAHPQTRGHAYYGIMLVLGPDSLADLRLGAKDPHEYVRARVVGDSVNLLELGYTKPRWPPPSSALIAEVRAFLAEMQDDPAPVVRSSARSMLAMVAQHQR
jgi:hypothetical protein